MPDHPEDIPQNGPPPAGEAYKDLQRAALQDLIDLSPDVADAAEAEIERGYRAAKEAAEEDHDWATSRIERRGHRIVEVGQRDYQKGVERIRATFEVEENRLREMKKAARQRVADEADVAEARAKQTVDHDVWLADSVLEATKNQLVKELKKLKVTSTSQRASLRAMESTTRSLLADYRLAEPATPDRVGPEPDPANDAAATVQSCSDSARQHIASLGSLAIPRLFVGARPYAAVLLPTVAAVALVGWLTHAGVIGASFLVTGPIALVGSLAVLMGLGILLRRVARSQVRAVYVPLAEALSAARAAVERYRTQTTQRIEQRETDAARQRDNELQRARSTFRSTQADIAVRRKVAHIQAKDEYSRLIAEAEARRDGDRQTAEQWPRSDRPRIEERYRRYLASAQQRHERRMDDCRRRYQQQQDALRQRWETGLSRIETLAATSLSEGENALPVWSSMTGPGWEPPRDFASVVGFGRLDVDLSQIAGTVHQYQRLKIDRSTVLSVPALLAFPDRCSLLLQAEQQGMAEAIGVIQAVTLRLLTSLPPGRVHLTIIDPVGLGQNFAGFMHLADYDEALIGGRIWTEASHIEQQLTDLTDHMETVIQKYLRNEFETIDAYNQQAGELAEPYRFLVIANFPTNFNDDSTRRLASIVQSGPRCGVYTLIASDRRQPLPSGWRIDDIAAHCVHLVHEEDRFVWKDEVFSHFPLTLDAGPPEEDLSRILHVVGEQAKDSNRVEVPFEIIAPSNDDCWTSDCTDFLSIPVGRCGATRQQHLLLGKGVAQHALIAGKTGSGKSTFLHVLITNLALWYRPDDVEFYLVDFKKGVEFKTYATHELPHARAIAIESDREFGLSVLQRIDAEMERRGDVYRRLGVQGLPGYRRAAPDVPMPRTLLIIDEFQVFFSEDDKLAQDAAMLIDRLVRQGRAFGIHLLLGSQTLGGTTGLARSTMGQMAVRVALQCSEADSQLILADDNTAARLLSRPGEAIYNDAGGLVEGNSPFQTAWLDDAKRETCLARVRELAADRQFKRLDPLIVFEGNAPADIRKNRHLTDLLDAPGPRESAAASRTWLGEAIAIKEPTGVTFRRQSGSNLIIIGQRDDAALGIMATAMVNLSAHHAPNTAEFYVLDGTPADTPEAGALARIAATLPQQTQVVEWRDVETTLAALADESRRRQESGRDDEPSVYVLIHGLQRYRMLRRSDDDFSFSVDGKDKPPEPGKQLAELLRDGPPLGIHILAWVDTATALERAFDRQTVREFDNRVLFQMSAADSSNLIDSPLANRLGYYRALFYSEEQGLLEKFRPYALPYAEWLDGLAARLG